MATDVQIASLALTRIGHDVITSFSSSGNKAQRWFDSNYEFIKKALLREHQWKFAVKRAILSADTIRDITAITAASPPVVTSAAHGFSDGDTIYIDSVVGMTQVNGLTFTVANQATNTFELSGVDASAYTAYSSGGKAYGYVAKEYKYRYALPSDNIRVLRINRTEADEFRVEGAYIYTDEGTPLELEYIFDVTDESAFDEQFVDLLAARLSAEISFYMTDNSTLTEQAWLIYNDKIRMARAMDAREGTPRGIDADTWINSRA